jgi:hypothetical protein
MTKKKAEPWSWDEIRRANDGLAALVDEGIDPELLRWGMREGYLRKTAKKVISLRGANDQRPEP